jgi:hypothetical protein
MYFYPPIHPLPSVTLNFSQLLQTSLKRVIPPKLLYTQRLKQISLNLHIFIIVHPNLTQIFIIRFLSSRKPKSPNFTLLSRVNIGHHPHSSKFSTNPNFYVMCLYKYDHNPIMEGKGIFDCYYQYSYNGRIKKSGTDFSISMILQHCVCWWICLIFFFWVFNCNLPITLLKIKGDFFLLFLMENENVYGSGILVTGILVTLIKNYGSKLHPLIRRNTWTIVLLVVCDVSIRKIVISTFKLICPLC